MTNINKSTLAKQVTFESYFLSRYGINLDTSKREVVILDPTRDDKHPSISIDFQKQLYNDFANGVGGSIIDWLMNKERATFCEACDALLNGSFSFCRPTSSLSLEPTEPTTVITEIVPIWNYALKNYLAERCISKEVYKKYLKEIRYKRNGKSYFALGFQSDSGGWEIRNKLHKGCIGTKNITHIKNDSNTLYIYEGFFDFLSHLTEFPDVDELADYLILNSTSHVKKSLPILDAYEYIECYTDQDKAGFAAGETLISHWAGLGKDRTNFGFHSPFIKGKDVNEQWVKECQRRNKTV